MKVALNSAEAALFLSSSDLSFQVMKYKSDLFLYFYVSVSCSPVF